MNTEQIEKEFRSEFGADYIDLIIWARANKDIKDKILTDLTYEKNT